MLGKGKRADALRRHLGRLALREEAGAGGKLWYRIESKSSEEAEIYLYDEISVWGVSAEGFVRDLKALDVSTIRLRINSPGGDAFDGNAMYNALRDHPAKIIVHIDGLAASMASEIAMAGDEVHMAENAFFMIHNPWVVLMGDSRDLRKAADLLDKIGKNMVTAYERKTGKSRAMIQEWLDEETWFDAQEAKTAGFVDVVESEGDVGALWDPEVYGFVNAPAALKRQLPAGEMTEREFEGFLRDAGFSKTQAAAITGRGFRSLRRGDPEASAVEELLANNIRIWKE